MSDATALTVFHRAPQRDTFTAWCTELAGAAHAQPGFVADYVGVADADGTDWAVSHTFDSEASLHAWLDSADRARLLAEGEARGIWRKNADLVLVPGRDLPPGTAVINHRVAPGKEDEFREAQGRLIALCATFPGFEGALTLPHGIAQGEWMAVLRFRTDEQLADWMESDSRAQALPELRSKLTEDFAVAAAHSTPFGSILRFSHGKTQVTPNWKTAMLVLLVLYPTVMLLSRFLGPVLDRLGAEPWLSLWLSQICSVGIMTWYFMPVVTGWFKRWLDPVDGAGWRISLIGAGIVLVSYAATLALFASVHWLQFWDYAD
jgi:antibiotic biosynthesis monooxygenase (ABM) superfamily enzyme